MNRLTMIVAMGLFATAAFAAPGAGSMRATMPAAHPAAPTTHTTTQPTTTTATRPTTTNTSSPRSATTGGQPNASC
jgi:hypothetical protein